MLQRRYWHTANSGKPIEKTRKRVNLAVRHIVGSIQGFTIRHVNIKTKESIYTGEMVFIYLMLA
jgi:hypothetical protein